MLLLLIRHADAGQHDPDRWPDDTLRPMTDKGRKRHRRMSRRLRRRGLVPALLLSSPWLRAWQTATQTALHTGGPEPVVCPVLAAPPDLVQLAAAIGPGAHDETVGLVGHEPWLGELASLLLTGDARRLQVDFPKSGILAVDTDEVAPGAGTLSFFWRPRD